MKDGIYLIKKWQIGTPDPAAADILSRQGGLSVLTAKALASRGIDTIEKAADFFGQNDDEQYSDPFLIRDMDKACDALSEAVKTARSSAYTAITTATALPPQLYCQAILPISAET